MPLVIKHAAYVKLQVLLWSSISCQKGRCSPSRFTTNQDSDRSQLSLESYTSYGLGSTANGPVVSKVPCSNTSSQRIGWPVCPNNGSLPCFQVWIPPTVWTQYTSAALWRCVVIDARLLFLFIFLKYCSGRCQRQHWPKHRPYLQSNWQSY